MSVHHEARRGFSQGAEAYERGRPAYPEEAVRWLVRQLALRPDRVVVDVGAQGTIARLFPYDLIAKIRLKRRFSAEDAEEG